MGNNTPKNNRIENLTAEQTLIDGFTKNATRLTNMAILGTTMPTKDIVATLQSRIDSAKAVLTAKAAWQVTVEADRALRDKAKTLVGVVKQGLLAAFAGPLDTFIGGVHLLELEAASPNTGSPDIYVYTTATSSGWPDLSMLGLVFPVGVAYRVTLIGLGVYDTIDAALGSDGIGAIAPAEARRADSDVVSAVTGM